MLPCVLHVVMPVSGVIPFFCHVGYVLCRFFFVARPEGPAWPLCPSGSAALLACSHWLQIMIERAACHGEMVKTIEVVLSCVA